MPKAQLCSRYISVVLVIGLGILGFRVSVSIRLRDLLVGLLSLNLLFKSGKFVRVISISCHVTM